MAAATLASKRDIPHFYVTRDVWLKHADQWRKTWNRFSSNPHASWNDIFVRCAAQALKAGDGLIAAGTEAAMGRQGGKDILVISGNEPGLTLVPVPDPSALPWNEFLKFMRESKLSYPAGFSPALAISNLGMHGVKQFAAIIPPGCRAVLAIGAVREECSVENGEILVKQICTLTLSADHRVVDGIAAAHFLEGMQHSLDAL
jgi:pyruvate dehydrogenase E2 component (dihydrolipoamide acetyltransferase)